jgi:diguanylate cyclase (GGDEF)-like protein
MKSLAQALMRDIGAQVDQDELRSFARSLGEFHWLSLILVVLYAMAPGAQIANPLVIKWAVAAYAGFIVIFRLGLARGRDTRLRIATEVIAMIAFVTVVTLAAGSPYSPLSMLYLVPIVVSGVTLGRWVTLLNTALIAACLLLVGTVSGVETLTSFEHAASFLTRLAPLILVAFVTSILAHDLRLAKSRIRTLSETDELTGLLNMRAFSRIHRREHEKAARHGRTYAILLIDIDNLKQINDANGHEAGNRAIIVVANVIARLIRVTDAAARYGGDEFIVLLSEIDPEAATIIGQRIRNSVQKTTLDVEGRMVRTRVSVGVATYPADSPDLRELVKRADTDMYRNKELQRPPTAESGKVAYRKRKSND